MKLALTTHTSLCLNDFGDQKIHDYWPNHIYLGINVDLLLSVQFSLLTRHLKRPDGGLLSRSLLLLLFLVVCRGVVCPALARVGVACHDVVSCGWACAGGIRGVRSQLFVGLSPSLSCTLSIRHHLRVYAWLPQVAL